MPGSGNGANFSPRLLCFARNDEKTDWGAIQSRSHHQKQRPRPQVATNLKLKFQTLERHPKESAATLLYKLQPQIGCNFLADYYRCRSGVLQANLSLKWQPQICCNLRPILMDTPLVVRLNLTSWWWNIQISPRHLRLFDWMASWVLGSVLEASFKMKALLLAETAAWALRSFSVTRRNIFSSAASLLLLENKNVRENKFFSRHAVQCAVHTLLGSTKGKHWEDHDETKAFSEDKASSFVLWNEWHHCSKVPTTLAPGNYIDGINKVRT